MRQPKITGSSIALTILWGISLPLAITATILHFCNQGGAMITVTIITLAATAAGILIGACIDLLTFIKTSSQLKLRKTP